MGDECCCRCACAAAATAAAATGENGVGGNMVDHAYGECSSVGGVGYPLEDGLWPPAAAIAAAAAAAAAWWGVVGSPAREGCGMGGGSEN